MKKSTIYKHKILKKAKKTAAHCTNNLIFLNVFSYNIAKEDGREIGGERYGSKYIYGR